LAKTQTLILVRPRRTEWLKAEGIDALLQLIFYKSRDLSRVAKTLIFEIRERQRQHEPYMAKDWKSFIDENKVSHSNYFSTLKRLVGAGLLRRERGAYFVSRDFATFLRETAEIWDSWLAS